MENFNYAIVKTNLYEQIADKLGQAIVHAEIKADKLPSEQELSKRFHVSRTVIREALKVLKERGLIQSRNGEGSYISKPNTDTVSSAISRLVKMDKMSNDDLHNTRSILETAGVRLAARHISGEELTALEHIITQMADESLGLEKRILLDAEFHIAITRAGGNELLRMFVEVMTVLLNEYMIKGVSGPIGIKNTLKQHRKILEALRKGNPDEAEVALVAHLVAARGNVGKYEQEQAKLYVKE